MNAKELLILPLAFIPAVILMFIFFEYVEPILP